jgi:hypothetical protein
MSIITQAPSWLMLFCLMAGVIYAGALYFRDRFNRTYGTPLATLLGVLRFACISLLCLFLLKPLIKTIEREVEKPIIVIAQDNSSSLCVGTDSSLYRGAYLEQLKQLAASFGSDYDVRTFTFGDGVHEGLDSVSYTDEYTDYSQLLEEINTRFSGRNLGALIVASDGLYNRGSNPVYAYEKMNAPIFTIALGDTTVHKDALIADVAVNRLAYLGNRFPLEITIEGRKASGESATVTVTRKGTTVFTQTIVFNGERSFHALPLTLEAGEIGLQRYTISLSRINNEITFANNTREVFIDVLDSRQKVLILAQAPHPDLNALREAISSNESYRTDVRLVKDFNGKVDDYNLIIYHQLPALGQLGSSVITAALEKKIPALFVWGSNTDFNAFNALQTGWSLGNNKNNSTDISAAYKEGFTLFLVDPKLQGLIRTLPPLQVPFGDFNFSNGIQPLITQQVGNIATSKPLIGFNTVNDVKFGLVAGEGLWRWRMTAFQQTESHDAFNELLIKCVQYLASKDDRSLFRVTSDHDFSSTQDVVFNAELYNASYEAIADREIGMRITNDAGESFSYLFSPKGSVYQLNAGKLPVGQYRYEATTTSDGVVLNERGEFSVNALQLEYVNTIADHNLLAQFARENNGIMVYPITMNELTERIQSMKEVVSVAYENKQLNELINVKWIAFLIIALLCGEWLLRKRAGTY